MGNCRSLTDDYLKTPRAARMLSNPRRKAWEATAIMVVAMCMEETLRFSQRI